MRDMHTAVVRMKSGDVFTYRAHRISISPAKGTGFHLDLSLRLSPWEIAWQQVDDVDAILSLSTDNFDHRGRTI